MTTDEIGKGRDEYDDGIWGLLEDVR
jgi:hypothetical protein